jgi:prepilin signal peptidase PulO-like enzyme (type II secretory pathway)
MLVLLLAGVIHRGTRVPFAPFLALGTLGALLFGTIIEQWMRLIL